MLCVVGSGRRAVTSGGERVYWWLGQVLHWWGQVLRLVADRRYGLHAVVREACADGEVWIVRVQWC